MTRRSVLLTAALLLPLPFAAHAAYPGTRDPDWPCQQIKVPDLSWGTVWNGPALDPYLTAWQQDAGVSALAHSLSERRVSLDEAKRDIAGFAQQAGSARQQRLPMLMAGVFDLLDQERSSVIAGLDRFGRRQRSFADELRADNAALHGLQAAPDTDPARMEQAVSQLTMELRVFEDRRQSLRYACNVPVTIEQRLYALGQAIQQAMQ